MKDNYISSKNSRTVDSKPFIDQLKRNFRNCVGTLMLTATPMATMYAQTNPVPQQVPYTQNFDVLPGNSATLPAGWAGWKLDGQLGISFSGTATANTTFAAGNNNSTAPGLYDMVGKLGFLSTNGSRSVPVLSIKTHERKDIVLKYDINVQRVNSNRSLIVRLQYRVGNTATFIDLPEYDFTFTGPGTGANIGNGVASYITEQRVVTLPPDVAFQDEVQFRWVTARPVNNQGSGDNHSFSIDNVEVTGNTPPDLPVPFPYTDQFDTSNWMLINGEQVNKFHVGTPTSTTIDFENNGKLFISNNGTDANYTKNSASISYAYKNVTLPANIETARLSFKWMARGESGVWDYGRFYIVPESSPVPVAGAEVTGRTERDIPNAVYYATLQPGTGNSTYPFALYNQGNAYTGVFSTAAHKYEDNFVDLSSLAGQTVRLVFMWRNDSGGGNDPALVVDDFNFDYTPNCVSPNINATTNIEGRTAQLNWTSTATNFEYYISTTNTEPTANTEATGTATGNNVIVTGLSPVTQYYAWVRAVCDGNETSDWSASTTFTTLISCPAPTALTTTNITPNGAEISWTSTSTGFEYIVTTTNTAPEVSATGTVVNTNSVTLTGLDDTTTYYWWVRAVCDTDDKSTWVGSTFQTLQIPASFPYSDNFNQAKWVFANGTQTNKFYIGTPEGANNVTYADNKLFVSNNGTNNSYATTASSVYAYRDITLPADITLAKISFDWILKGEGGATSTSTPYDYGRFYIVPTTVTPNAGTNLGYEENIPNAIYSLRNNPVTTPTGRKHYLLYNPSHTYTGAFEEIAHKYVDEAVNLTGLGGQTVRLIFFFRNDSGAYPPSLAIDNFEITEAPSCLTVSDLDATNITFNQATLNWVGNAESYTYYLSTTNTVPTGDVGTTTTDLTVNATDLEASTTYYWWIKAACDATNTWVAGPSFTTNSAPSAFPFTDNFETSNWTFVNGTQTNKFYVGTPETSGNITFDNSKLFISNNGTKAEYGATTNHTYVYKDVILPTDLTLAKLTFKWLAAGESNPWDYGRFYITTTDVTPEAGIEIDRITPTVPNSIFNAHHNLRSTNTFAFYKGSAYEAGSFNEQAHTYLKEDLDLSEYAGQTVRLVFYWRNDGLTQTQPSLVVDDFELTYAPSCLTPVNLSVSDVSSNSASLSWNGNSEQYTYFYSTTNVLPETGFTTSEQNITIEGLESNTTYYWWVKSVCDNDTTAAEGRPFTTLIAPKSYPFTDNFNGTNDWILVNGTQTNKFEIGTPVNSQLTFEDGALFVSNNGISNTYTINSASSSYAYVDVVVPTDVDSTELAFDWYNKGELLSSTYYDFGRIFVTPISYTPTAGTTIAFDGSIEGQYFASSPLQGSTGTGSTFNEAKGQFTTTLDLSEQAGQTVRLIFYWRNDSSSGIQPPLAIDNFYFGPVRDLGTNHLSNSNFEYYPNPVQNELNIKGDQTISSIELFNLTGQVVNQVKVDAKSYTLNTSKLSAGVYMVRVAFENGTTKTVKIIKK